jgi:hypothetical protein
MTNLKQMRIRLIPHTVDFSNLLPKHALEYLHFLEIVWLFHVNAEVGAEDPPQPVRFQPN